MKITTKERKKYRIRNKLKNIGNACRLVRKAASLGAKVIILPEVFNYRGPLVEEELYNEIAEVIPGESIIPLMKIAKQNNINIIAGSIYEKSEVKNKSSPTSKSPSMVKFRIPV